MNVSVIPVEVFSNLVVSWQHTQAREMRRGAGGKLVDSDHCLHAKFPFPIPSQPSILELRDCGKEWEHLWPGTPRGTITTLFLNPLLHSDIMYFSDNSGGRELIIPGIMLTCIVISFIGIGAAILS